MNLGSNWDTIILTLMFVALVALLIVDSRLKKNLTKADRTKVKFLVPVYFWIVFLLIMFSRLFLIEFFGFIFSDLIYYSLILVGILIIGIYRIWKLSKVGLPANYVGKARKWTMVYVIFVIIFIGWFVLSTFIKWKSGGYKIYF